MARGAYSASINQMQRLLSLSATICVSLSTFVVDVLSQGIASREVSQPDCKIAFAGSIDGKRGIHFADVDGGVITQVTDGRWDVAPSWSPDGKWIAFLSKRDNDMEKLSRYGMSMHWMLLPKDADGGNQRRLTEVKTKSMLGSWSPDGTCLAFSSRGNIYVINVDGSNQRRLTSDPADDEHPLWSPGGSKIAFVRGQRTEVSRSVYVMDSQGLRTRKVVADAEPLAWLPDDKKLIVQANENYTIVDVDSGRRDKPTGRPETLLKLLPCNPTLQEIVGRRMRR